MRKLFVPFINQYNINEDIEKVSILLDVLPKNQIYNQPWPAFKNHLQASFTIGHTNDAICLKFDVSEDAMQVATFETNGAVHKDSCVEFFVSFGEEQSYYNIEVNCLGVCLVAHGNGRLNRTFIEKQLVEQIRTFVTIKTPPLNSQMKHHWQITLIVPIAVFAHSNLETLGKQEAFGNFFKCGDDLPQAHFYSWSMIEAETPDFHLPEFFGALTFG